MRAWEVRAGSGSQGGHGHGGARDRNVVPCTSPGGAELWDRGPLSSTRLPNCYAARLTLRRNNTGCKLGLKTKILTRNVLTRTLTCKGYITHGTRQRRSPSPARRPEWPQYLTREERRGLNVGNWLIFSAKLRGTWRGPRPRHRRRDPPTLRPSRLCACAEPGHLRPISAPNCLSGWCVHCATRPTVQLQRGTPPSGAPTPRCSKVTRISSAGNSARPPGPCGRRRPPAPTVAPPPGQHVGFLTAAPGPPGPPGGVRLLTAQRLIYNWTLSVQVRWSGIKINGTSYQVTRPKLNLC